MIKKVIQKWPLSLILIFFVYLFGLYTYTKILPYNFSPQFLPTEANLNKTGKYDFSDQEGIFLGQKVRSHDIVQRESEEAKILGAYDASKRIEVDLANQRLYAYEGGNKVMDFLVSTGKWGRTPTGTFRIQYKNYVQKMEGGNKEWGTYYYLPNVHYVQFFGNEKIPWSRGFSFHEAYWHNNFGHPMSHGCVNMRFEDARALYDWTSPDVGGKWWAKASDSNMGTTVVIYGETPKS